MHKALAIEDVLQRIAQTIAEDPEAIGDTLALGKCSKAIIGPMLNELWRFQYNIAVLFQAAPSDLWGIRGQTDRNMVSMRIHCDTVEGIG